MALLLNFVYKYIMTEEAQLLGEITRRLNVVWNPDEDTCLPVVKWGTGPDPGPDGVPEPGMCAYFANGKYVALYAANCHEFKLITPIAVEPSESDKLDAVMGRVSEAIDNLPAPQAPPRKRCSGDGQ